MLDQVKLENVFPLREQIGEGGATRMERLAQKSKEFLLGIFQEMRELLSQLVGSDLTYDVTLGVHLAGLA